MPARVVVTGIGAITPVGTGRRAMWEGLLAGRCGTGPVTSFDTSRYSVHQGGEIHDFRAADHLRTLDPGSIGRASQLAASAARLALDDAGLDPSALPPERCGVVMGTTSGEPLEVERFDDLYTADELGSLGGEFIARYPCHHIAANVASEVGFAGHRDDDPHRLRRRQLRHRPRRRPARRRPRRADAGRRRRQLLAHHLHRLRPPGRHRARRLPPVRPQPQGDDPRRGGGGAGARAAGAGVGARRHASTPRWPATASPATPTT